jgi:hypothetical protein
MNSLFQIRIVGQVSRTSKVVGDEVVTVGDAGVELVAVFRISHQQSMLQNVFSSSLTNSQNKLECLSLASLDLVFARMARAYPEPTLSLLALPVNIVPGINPIKKFRIK